MMRLRPRRAPTIPTRPCTNVRRAPWVVGNQRWSSEKTRPAPPNWRLEEQLQKAIEVTGPISVAKYMRQCLTAMELGYYSRSSVEDEQIGTKGDFITSPEISQMFGELVGIWIVSEWMAQGQKTSGLHLIEFGPGKGTLMDDILRTLRNFPTLFKGLEGITLVESSENLRIMQSKLLCPSNSKPVYDESIVGYRSVSKYSADLPITWTSESRYLPKGKEISPFIIAHEFFDALPIHAFQTVDSKASGAHEPGSSESNGQSLKRSQRPQNRWRELLVDNKVPSPSLTTSSTSTSSSKPDSDKFQLCLSNTDTPHSLLLPLESPRYGAVLDMPAGSTIEISPESLSLARQISILIGGSATRVTPPNPRPRRPTSPPPSQPEPRNGPPSGAALIIDYGPSNTIPTKTLRGIRSHKLVSPFSSPGSVDLSADVDFGGLVHAALEASEDVEVHGPVPQGYFLRALGGEERLKMMLEKIGKDGKGAEELRERLEKAWVRLVDQGLRGMGGVYKAMAILPSVRGKEGRRPVGFGGGLVESQNA